jgi:hypothetical protein
MNSGDFSYFFIVTKFGVGGERSENINTISFGLEFCPVEYSHPPWELKNNRARKVAKVGVKGGLSLLEFLETYGIAEATLNRDHVKKRSIEASWPYKIQVIRSSGLGTNANWEFKQGGVSGYQGEFPLGVVFRIRKPIEKFKKGTMYKARPDIRFDGQRINTAKEGNWDGTIPVEINRGGL